MSQLDPRAVQAAYQCRTQRSRAIAEWHASHYDPAIIERMNADYERFDTYMADLGYPCGSRAYYWHLHAAERLTGGDFWRQACGTCPGCTEPLD
jgi:hypothetical protein